MKRVRNIITVMLALFMLCGCGSTEIEGTPIAKLLLCGLGIPEDAYMEVYENGDMLTMVGPAVAYYDEKGSLIKLLSDNDLKKKTKKLSESEIEEIENSMNNIKNDPKTYSISHINDGGVRIYAEIDGKSYESFYKGSDYKTCNENLQELAHKLREISPVKIKMDE